MVALGLVVRSGLFSQKDSNSTGQAPTAPMATAGDNPAAQSKTVEAAPADTQGTNAGTQIEITMAESVKLLIPRKNLA